MPFIVLFRKGGTQNYQWCQTLETHIDVAGASMFAAGIAQQGYRTHITTLEELAEQGLPKSFEPPRRWDD